jgi:hypothetical protein
MSEEAPLTNDAPTTDAAAAGADTALAAAVSETEAATEAVKPDAEAEAPAPSALLGAPEEYDVAAFAMPEGVEFDAEMFDLVKDDLKGLDLSQEGAGKIVALFAEKVTPKIAERVQAQIEASGQELSAQFARDLQADPVVGGAKLKEAQAMAAKAIASAIPDAAARSTFSQFLNESGLGNHPLLMRVIAAGGRAMSEASTPAGAVVAEKSATEKFYPNRSNA